MRLKLFFFLFLIDICDHDLYAQGRPYHGPDDPAADPAAVREGYMNGNRILLYFQNTTELAKWTSTYIGSQWSRWPNNNDGVRMLDGIAFMAAARVYLENDSIPVTDLNIIRNRSDLDTLFYLQTSYREEVDRDLTGQIIWGFYPVVSYINPSNNNIAMSTSNFSWPAGGWPAEGSTLKWPGEWIGRFGRGKISADLESFFVVNDAQDQEYLGPEDIIRYYPRPNVKIGDIPPAPSVQAGKPWGGIGIRVEQRGYQWKEILARDILFWEYKISNISDYDLPEIILGFWIDNGIGGESDDELCAFNFDIDLTFVWDTDETGYAGMRTGAMGLALLETPSVDYDGNDNDQDGLVDEKRENSPVQIIGSTDGISDLSKFLDYYHLDADSLREHWDADEDQDWRDGKDLNTNGVYDEGEYPGDDVGLDGVAPADLNYTGPDEGEGNHQPDCLPGIGCEPNFNYTDVHEGDMLGLTTLEMMPLPSHSAPGGHWFRNDRSMWELLNAGEIKVYSGDLSNLIIVPAAGPFTLYQGRDAWISLAEVHSYEMLEGLNSDDPQAPSLFAKKQVAQAIFQNDYRIGNIKYTAKVINVPGDQPTIQQAIYSAYPGDTILVHPGVYLENITISQKELVLASLYLTTHNSKYISQTIINGDSAGSVIIISDCDKMKMAVSVSGFTITNGKAIRGGGIHCSNSSPKLSDLIITENQADYGGGIYSEVDVFFDVPSIWTNLRIIGNHARLSGGGIYTTEGWLAHINLIENMLITQNIAPKGSGIFTSCASVSEIKIFNSTLLDDILVEFSNTSFINCIIWPEQLPFINTANANYNNALKISHCDIKGGKSELDTLHNFTITYQNGNIEQDPQFIDSGNNDFNLQSTSPCIDAGTDSIQLESLIDLANNERIWDGNGDQIMEIDIGAYEYGAPPVVQDLIEENSTICRFILKQNYPNPFNHRTTISFEIPNNSYVTLKIYDLLGREVETLMKEKLNAGSHAVYWNAMGFASGVYLYRLQTGNYSETKKLILLK